MNFFSVADNPKGYITFPFYYNGKPVAGFKAGLTLKSSGSMRFRWNEINTDRDNKLTQIIRENASSKNIQIAPVELIHSKIVYSISKPSDTSGLTGDGIITMNPEIMPVVTVADCMPLYLYDIKKKVFGIVHSGWKGTGIAVEAIKLACREYGSAPEDFSVVLGPHIKSCCYIVNEERASYFAENFTPECVVPLEENGNCCCGGKGLPVPWNNGNGKLFRLSLKKANLWALQQAGVRDENISVCESCTCCSDFLGSNRRETATATASAKAETVDVSRAFTVMAAFVISD